MTDHTLGPRDRLIAIAMDLIDRDHPEDLSLREVARRAGLTSGAPAHHFGNKMGLLVACAEVAWKDLSLAMERTETDATPAEAIHHKARAYIGFALSKPGPYRLLMSRRFVDKSEFAVLSAWRTRAVQGVVEQVERALGPSDDHKFPYRRGVAMWSLLHGFVTLNLNEAISADMREALIDEICDCAVEVALSQPKTR
ncbi:MAG: TetR/AcrR family transcriptional regulator [Pseudomonadota bacterium]